LRSTKLHPNIVHDVDDDDIMHDHGDVMDRYLDHMSYH